MYTFIFPLIMFLIFVLPPQAAAGIVVYRIAKTYILIGLDSYSGFNSSDQTCKVAVLRDTHIFSFEEISPGASQIKLTDIAKDVLNAKPNASTSVLLKAWVMSVKLGLQALLTTESAKTLKTNGSDVRTPLTRGFVGEVKATGSRWSFAEIAMSREWDDTMYLNQTPKDMLFSRQYGDLINKALEENGAKLTENMELDAVTMEQVIRFLIQNAPDPKTVGGVPIVVGLQYGTGVHWFAGADQCARQH